MQKALRVLLVDDHAILRDGIAAILQQVSDVEVVGALSSAEEAIGQFASLNPDVILMDILMGGMTGLEATRLIKEQDPSAKIIIVSSEIKREYVSLGLKVGIDGYLPKNVDKDTLVHAIREVVAGNKYFNTAITNLIFEDFCNGGAGKKRNRTAAIGLTKRETEVLEMVASGQTNQEIADTLFLSVKTVETHKGNILDKLGLRNTAELVRYAIKHNIISVD